jgi:hypothetical protein
VEIGRLHSLKDKLKGNDTYYANQVEVQRLAAAGILAHVRGDDKKAVALVRAAADLDATDWDRCSTSPDTRPGPPPLIEFEQQIGQQLALRQHRRWGSRVLVHASAAFSARPAPRNRRAIPRPLTTPTASLWR